MSRQCGERTTGYRASAASNSAASIGREAEEEEKRGGSVYVGEGCKGGAVNR